MFYRRNGFQQYGALALLAGLILSVSVYSSPATAEGDESWDPVSSEQLIRLPAVYLDKYVERDYRDSTLFAGIVELDEQTKLQLQHMHSLRDSIERAQGETKTELRHQLLVAKSDYIDIIERRQDLERQALETRIDVYGSTLNRIQDKKRVATDPLTRELVASQQQARQRMLKATAMVDSMLAMSSDTAKTRYAEEYTDNLNRIDALKSAIARHAANSGPAIDGKTVSREDYVRYLMANSEGQLAILDQERLMLTYMSRLVALDAHALEQEILFAEDAAGGVTEAAAQSRLADVTTMFIE